MAGKSKKKIKTAIIGVGGISGAHRSGYDKCDNAELWAICDIKPDVLKAKSERWGIPPERCFLDHRDLLKLKEIEAVNICTPNKAHCEIAVNALRAGKHVLCEKPIAMNAKEGQRMVTAAEKANRILQIGLMQRFRADANYIKGLVDDGTLGEIYYARCRAIRRRGVPSWGVFGQLAESGGGGLIDVGVHLIDLTWYAMGHPRPIAVSGQTYRTIGTSPGHWGQWGQWDHTTYTVEDFATGLVRFENGATMTIECGFIANLDANSEDFHIVGDKGGAGTGPLSVQVELGGHLCDATPQDVRTTNLKGQFAKLSGYELEVMHFVDCIINNKPTRVPGKQILWVQKIIDGLYKSAEVGREVKIQ